MITISNYVSDAWNLGPEQSVTWQPAGRKSKGTARNLLIATILVVTLITPGLAIAQTDPFTGTWILNLSKSKFEGGPARKSEKRIVLSTPTGMKVDVDRTYADGTNQQFEYTSNLDGKSYPITGTAPYDADSISMNLSAPNTITFKILRGGKVIGSGSSVVSADGKTLTLTSKGTDAKGKTTSAVAVYDKQQ
jgi:hypothetical protein